MSNEIFAMIDFFMLLELVYKDSGIARKRDGQGAGQTHRAERPRIKNWITEGVISAGEEASGGDR